MAANTLALHHGTSVRFHPVMARGRAITTLKQQARDDGAPPGHHRVTVTGARPFLSSDARQCGFGFSTQNLFSGVAMTSVQALALVDQFARNGDALSADEHAQLLDWARTTPLLYGAWQPFKRWWKTLDTRALDPNRVLSNDELQLLAALAARVDAVALPAAAPRLQPIEVPDNIWDGKRERWNGLMFHVTGRNRYDWSGWRLLVGEETGKSNWSERFPALRALLGLPALASNPTQEADKKLNIRAAWDFNARDYIGRVEKTELKGDILTVRAAYGGHRADGYAIDISDPAFPHLVTTAPRPETWQYMKRRARRLLRTLSETQPERYWQVLAALLHESAHAQPDGTLNPNTQWALMWALHGNGERFAQKLAGRGPYRLKTGASPLQRTRREESAPALWNAHLNEMRILAQDENVPLQANLIALQVLAANKQARPELLLNQALRFLNGDALWLKTIATREIGARMLRGESITGALSAATFLHANARLRRQLQSSIENQLQSGNGDWCHAFAVQALQILKVAPKHRRARLAAEFLARFGRDVINSDDLFRYLNLWLSLGDDAAHWALEQVREAGGRGNTTCLNDINTLQGEIRERILEAFLRDAGKNSPSKSDAWALVTGGDSARNELGWRYVDASSIDAKTLRDVWKQLITSWQNEDVYRAAFGSAAGARLWLRAAWSAKDSESWFNGYYSAWSRMKPYVTVEFVRAVMHFVAPDKVASRVFSALPLMDAAIAPQISEAFLDATRDFSPTASEITGSLLHAGVSWPYTQPSVESLAATWRFLAASKVTAEVLQEVWHDLFARPISGDSVAPAIAILRRANLNADDIEKWLQAAPELAATFAPNFFAALFSLSSGTGKVNLAVGATPEQWRAARPLLLQVLAAADLRSAFWDAIWQRLREDGQSLQERLLGDREISDSFALLDNATIAEMLATDEPAHESLLERWLDAHQNTLTRSDVALIAASTCPLSTIRERGLAHVREIGLDLPLALRLIESNLPPAMQLAQNWFEGAPNSSEAESDYALALCDSPQAVVRQWGRDFVSRRANSLLNSELLRKLSEGGDAQNQAFVAQQLQAQPQNFDTSEFDSAVLKSRGRARSAKTAVQQRLSQTANESEMTTQALLELARGRVPRDREWALQQLARLAQNGAVIEGVELVAHEN